MPFSFTKLAIPEVVLIEPKIIRDSRGFLMEAYKYSDFARAGIEETFVQDNFSRSTQHVLRGLHYQTNPTAQGKLIRCTHGRIFDVAVDIRPNAATFGQWVGVELSDTNNHILYVPTGFAHGFLTLSDTADIYYKMTREYSPDNERGLIWNDPKIHIQWPVDNPILAEKDLRHPTLDNIL
ncbi:MAG: dTDP-4-dehydrorhamnose 3,5-epimerase [Deltaproteobacteria bacterium]|nr:dTDP-4-dehydrorhamnose 3,5-epimerase [Deltaproteobacteria bacterium]